MTSATATSPVDEQRLIAAIREWQRVLEQRYGSADRLTTEIYLCQECGEPGADTRHCVTCEHDTKKIRALISYGM